MVDSLRCSRQRLLILLVKIQPAQSTSQPGSIGKESGLKSFSIAWRLSAQCVGEWTIGAGKDGVETPPRKTWDNATALEN